MSTESTKQRAFRIDLDHHKRPEPLSRAKWLLAIVAAVASVAYAGYLFAPNAGGEVQLSPGHVAAVHAGLNQKCTACHANFHAVRGDAWGMNEQSLAKMNENCQACHAAPDHHAVSKETRYQVESCGGCHQDHQGLDASLVRMDDAHCTRCHVRLGDVKGGQTAFHSPTKSFEVHQKQFPSLKSDPGKLNFSHAVHMTRGLPLDEEGRALSNYEDIDPEFLNARVPDYANNRQGPVQLDCSSCHEPQANDDRLAFSGQMESPRRDSAHMAPIQFDRHCAACHKLTVGEKAGDVVPHGLEKEELQRAVQALAVKAEGAPASGAREEYADILAKPPQDLIANRLKAAPGSDPKVIETGVRTACGKCHTQDPFAGAIDPNIPSFWFEHARFDHAAHRDVQCRQCHPQARGRGDDGNQAFADLQPLFEQHKLPDSIVGQSAQVMILGYENCNQCHRPASASPASPSFGLTLQGARSDCVECHTYHGGELTSQTLRPRFGLHPPQGPAP